MANFFNKLWRYVSASANQKLDEKADPRVQIEQAIQDAQKQHQVLVQQAAAVLGNRRQLEMKLARQLSEVENVQASTRQSLVLADQARATGDLAKAQQFENSAQSFATQLIAAETSVNDLKNLHDQALQSAEQAKAAVEDNELRLRNQLAERSKLLTQLEHAKMQEQMSSALSRMSELQPAGDTPSLTQVRDKIEKRYATALGQHELASQGVEARMLEVRKSTMDMQATNRLAEIRAGLAAGSTNTPAVGAGGAATPSLEKGANPAIESGQPAAATETDRSAGAAAPPQQ
jgi:phage shock protein A